jgi:Fe-S-cluster-containing hydrogenase component 2
MRPVRPVRDELRTNSVGGQMRSFVSHMRVLRSLRRVPRPDAKKRDTGAENQICPTAAITRTFIERPYFQYTIDEDLCIGCGKCVKGCGLFGNGSLYMQVKQDLCVNCNECAIAVACPSDAFERVSESDAYLLKTRPKKEPDQT